MENAQKDEEEVMRSTSSMLPAQPKNGTMKTYENPSRTFTRPYSAKTVYFYKEGDLYFTGVRLPVSHHRYKNLHNLMDELNRNMYLPYGVRNITTPMGRTNISSLDQLQHLGRYVASSSNPPKGVDLDKIQEKYSATLRREQPQRSTVGGFSYWMPTTPTLPARINATRIIKALNLVSAKQVFFVLNGKGKFYRAMINPMKLPSMEQLLEDCSSHLEVAIHRLYTPEGKLITTVEEILAHDGPRIIACPRNERPHLNEKSASTTVKLPEIDPKRYAPRQPYTKSVVETNSSAASGSGITSGSSSGNSMEKRPRLPALNHRFVPKKTQENGISSMMATTTTATNYISKSYAARAKQSAPPSTNHTQPKSTSETRRKSIKSRNTDASNSTSAASSAPKDSGTGTSINSQQSDRPESMTERKAQMIRDELRSNLRQQQQQNSSSDQYSEEDMIREEESDYDHLGQDGIHSGTSEEDEEDQKLTLGKKKKSTKKSVSSGHRTPAHRTPSTAGTAESVGKISRGSLDSKKRLKTMSRQDTPYHETPSRQSTGASSSTQTDPKSSHSSRAPTASKAILEASDDDEEDVLENGINDQEDGDLRKNGDTEDEETDDENDSLRETPAIHTPDTRLPTAKSRQSSVGSARSFESDSSRAWSRISGYSDKEMILPSDEEEDPYRDIGTAERERLGEAATKIQVAYKNYREHKEKKKRVAFEKEEEEKRRIFEENNQTYKIVIKLGERYAIDFDTPLFVVLCGDKGVSEKLYTRQKSWLFSIVDHPESPDHGENDDLNEGRHFDDGKLSVHMLRETHNLGGLNRIIVGHEKQGYGAGTFIESVTVTEEGRASGRRYYFQVDKWFDSGQTDGSIERTIDLYAFLYLETSLGIMKISQGRWEFRLHTMKSDLGGTTSNLTIYGYGMFEYVAYFVKNDSLMRDPSAVSLIQIDFGMDIGALRKVRFEIDGAGDRPDYFLEYVEVQDLDTMERCVIMVNNWLLIEANHGHRKWQPFREIPIYTQLYEPMPMRTYEGTVILGDQSLTSGEDVPLFLQCFSNEESNPLAPLIDNSGRFPVVQTKMKNGKINFTYKVDVVTYSLFPPMRIIPNVTRLGIDILNGLSVLEDIYADMVDVGTLNERITVGNELFVEEIIHKLGEQFPYIMSYSESETDYEPNNKEGPYFKQIRANKFTPISTEKKWKKSEARPVEEYSNWELLMSFDMRLGNPDIPTVVLVAEDGRTFEMECPTGKLEQEEEYDLFLRYTVKAPNFGNPVKCRVSLEKQSPGTVTKVFKMILFERNTQTHFFFKVNADIPDFHTEELQCIYSDTAVKNINDYEVDITTIEGKGNFRPYINIHGDGGDTGYRPYPGDRSFTMNPVSELFIYAVDLGHLRRIEVWAKTGEPQNWKGTIKVIVMNEWEFESGVLELSKNGQIALSPLEYKRRIDPLISGETDL